MIALYERWEITGLIGRTWKVKWMIARIFGSKLTLEKFGDQAEYFEKMKDQIWRNIDEIGSWRLKVQGPIVQKMHKN